MHISKQLWFGIGDSVLIIRYWRYDFQQDSSWLFTRHFDFSVYLNHQCVIFVLKLINVDKICIIHAYLIFPYFRRKIQFIQYTPSEITSDCVITWLSFSGAAQVYCQHMSMKFKWKKSVSKFTSISTANLEKAHFFTSLRAHKQDGIFSKKSTLFICIESGVLACIIKPAVYWMGSTKWFILKQLISQNEGIRRKHDNIMHNIWVNILHLTKIVYLCEKNGRKILLGAWFHLWYAIYSVREQNNSSFMWLRFSKIIKKTRNENWIKSKKQRNLLWFLKFNCSN